MPSRRQSVPDDMPTRRSRATTPEARDRELIALAVEEAERQIRAGTVSAQVLSHYLKLGSPKEKLERENLELQNELLRVKAEQVAAVARSEDLYKTAIDAMRAYSGQEPLDDDPYGEDDRVEYYED